MLRCLKRRTIVERILQLSQETGMATWNRDKLKTKERYRLMYEMC
jgi:hypothetical protein